MTRRELLEHTAALAADYLDAVDREPVGARASAEQLHAALWRPLAEEGAAARDVIDELARDARAGLTGSAGSRFFGWVIGGSVPAALAADWLTSTWDQNAGMYAVSPAGAVIEEVCRVWLTELLGLPADASVALVTGTQMAHTTAFAVARHQLLAERGIDVETDGLAGAPRLRLLCPERRHVTVDRAARLVGFGTASIVPIPCPDGRGLDAAALGEALAASDAPTIVVLQAGDVDTGAFDPFAAAVPLAREHGAWVHVDGAFGLWAAVSPATRHLLDGFEQADSWATDAHKWLNVPYDCGFAFTRHATSHRTAMAARASYLVPSESQRDPSDFNPELSRRGRGIAVYAAIRSMGRRGIRELVERNCEAAARLVEGIGGLPGAEVVSPACINQGLVRFLDADGAHDARTDQVISAIQREGTAFFGGTTWNGGRAMRVSVSGWQTYPDDVDRTIDAVARVLAAT